jgi:hypothetical protein
MILRVGDDEWTRIGSGSESESKLESKLDLHMDTEDGVGGRG